MMIYNLSERVTFEGNKSRQVMPFTQQCTKLRDLSGYQINNIAVCMSVPECKILSKSLRLLCRQKNIAALEDNDSITETNRLTLFEHKKN